jgi:eukaryotic-like serine/threonine-protein kinase
MTDLQTERALFEACLAQPRTEREAWLGQHCADAALRERIDRLLRAHESAEARDALASPLHTQPDERIGPYRVLERIGEGAMGEVFLAEQTAPVVRRVALKIIKPGMDSREVIARFELERQTLALMNHPRIAHIIDAGATASGRPYFAMEYVPGVPLTRYCDQHRLSIDERLALFLQICDAVQHAHQKGVIHRDLKPGNLLVAEIDGSPRVKVIDFGIAKAVSATHAPSRAHTMIGHLIGTPEYMSPEQAQLSPLDVDTRADVYSLGVVLHELLTGVLPFKASDANASPAVLVQELMTHNPAAPSVRVRNEESDAPALQRASSPRQLAARLRGDLDWIVLKALEKDRNRRYGSPSELAADIRRHLASEPVLAGPPSTLYRMRKFAARHSVAVAVAVSVFAATMLFGALMAYQARETARQRDQARFEARRAEASSEFMSLMLEEVGPGGRPLSPLELVDRGVEMLDKRYGDDPRFAATMLIQMARRYMDLGDAHKQAAVLDRAQIIANDLHDYELSAAIGCVAVQVELEAGRSAEAKIRLESALGDLARAAEPAVATRVDCLRARSDLAIRARNFDEAARLLDQARIALEEADATRGLQYNAVVTDLGGVYFRTARYREALDLNTESAAALERNGRGGTLAHVTVMGNRATLLYRLGETLRAEATGRETLLRLEALRESAPAAPATAINYANTLLRLERADQAIAILTKSREDAQALRNEHWRTIATLLLARAYVSAGRPAEAQAHIDDVRASWSEDASANRERLADLERTQAELELARGRLDAALDASARALEMYGYGESELAPGLAAGLMTATRVALRMGRADQAETYAAEALRAAESVARDPRQSSDVGEALMLVSAARLARGQREGVQQLIDRASEALTNGLGREHRLTRVASALRQDPPDLAQL